MPPERCEIEVAWLLARHFKCEVEFLIPVDDYLRKTPDIKMLGIFWEIKCPIGSSKTTVGNQFKRATKQARNIIFDARRLRISDTEIERKVRTELLCRKSIRRLLLINKSEKVIEIKR